MHYIELTIHQVEHNGETNVLAITYIDIGNAKLVDKTTRKEKTKYNKIYDNITKF